jgi:hypothetical protein
MKRIIWIVVTLIVLAALAGPATVFAVQAYSGIPTISIVSVITDQKVTIQTDNFPAGYDFKVLMAPIGTHGVGGTLVATTGSGAGGAFQATYTIPAGLVGAKQIAIRMENKTGGFFAYNWFWNNTTGGTGGPIFAGIPSFSIQSVVVDSKVTIKTNNFPANYDFKVLMGEYGTLGIGGTVVATTNSGTGGVFSATYNIPATLVGRQRIAIRMESTTGGFFAYNWFWNNTTGGTVVPIYTGVPTFKISAVAKDATVTILGSNFPASKDFKVYMGAYGTAGIGGTYVGTTSTGSGGTLTATYTIPAGLKGSTRIAIRMEATSGGWFAYNWFYNATAP